jgi:hypothetical protein
MVKWIVAFFAVLLAIIYVRVFKRADQHAKLVNASIRGWLAEKPSRTEQKDIFLSMATAVGVSGSSRALAFVQCVTRASTEDGQFLGRLLAEELENIRQSIVWDDIGEGEKMLSSRAEFHRIIDETKAKLIGLDS